MFERLQKITESGTKQALTSKFEKKLTYYSNVINAFDYAETLADIFVRKGGRAQRKACPIDNTT